MTLCERLRVLLAASSSGAPRLAGLAALLGSASTTAVESLLEALACVEGWEEAPSGYATVDLTSGGLATSDVPSGASEVWFFCHGYGAWRDIGLDNAYTYDEAMRRAGHDVPVVAVLWSAVDPNWYRAKDTVEAAGRRFAGWLEGYIASNPGTTVRLAGHSMGGRFVLAVLDALDGVAVDDAVLLGAAVDDTAVCGSGRWSDGVGSGAGHVHNFHSWKDEVVGIDYAAVEGTYAAGHAGADCGVMDAPPANYADHDVTDAVPAHCDYHRPDLGCVPTVLDVVT